VNPYAGIEDAATDLWRGSIEAFVAGKEEVRMRDVFAIGLEIAPAKVNARTRHRAAKILRFLGWVRSTQTRGGKSVRVWRYHGTDSTPR
jgi:hypothetical protein